MDGTEIIARAQSLALHSDSTEHYTRTYLTPAHQAAARQIARWMRDAGMAVRTDAVGNVIGRYDGAAADAKALLIGSHFDSVRNGGKYDGVLGILLGIACVADLARRGERLAVAIEVVAFADEEGTRFQTGMLSSRSLVSGFDPGLRSPRLGASHRQAMRKVGSGSCSGRIDPRSPRMSRCTSSRALSSGRRPRARRGDGDRNRRAAPHDAVTGERPRGTVRWPCAMTLAAAAEMVLAVERRCSAGGSSSAPSRSSKWRAPAT
jgi:hypothetical protein